jgi:hypothetical protein
MSVALVAHPVGVVRPLPCLAGGRTITDESQISRPLVNPDRAFEPRNRGSLAN